MRTKEEKEVDRKAVLGAGRPSSEVMATLELCRTIDDLADLLSDLLLDGIATEIHRAWTGK